MMKYNNKVMKPNDVYRATNNSAVSGAASGRRESKASQVVIKRNPYNHVLKVGTWNVRTSKFNIHVEN